MMQGIIPKFTVWGLAEYMLWALGLSVGVALFAQPAGQVEGLIAGLKK